jgi:hypothetical protein
VVVALVVALRSARGRLAQVVSGLSRGQALFSRPRATALAMAAGTLSWAAQIGGIWAALEAFGIHVGLAGAGLVFVSSTIVQLFPFWPGNLGIFQLGVSAPLVNAYAISTASAVAFSVGLQVVEALLGVGLGLVFRNREASRPGQGRLAARDGVRESSPGARLSGTSPGEARRPHGRFTNGGEQGGDSASPKRDGDRAAPASTRQVSRGASGQRDRGAGTAPDGRRASSSRTPAHSHCAREDAGTVSSSRMNENSDGAKATTAGQYAAGRGAP